MRLLARAARLVPRGRLPWQADILLDWVRQDPEPSAAVFQGLFFGRTAPPREERREIADAGAGDRPPVRPHPPVLGRRDARLRAAERAVAGGELADRAAGRAAAADGRDRARSSTSAGGRARARRAHARPESLNLAATLTPPVCRVAKRKRNAASASARRREAAEKASAARRKRMQLVFGVVLAVRGRRSAASSLVVGRRSAAATTARPSVPGGRARRSRRSRRPTSRRPRRPRAARSSTRPTRARATRRRTSRPPTTSRTRPPRATTSRSGTRTASTRRATRRSSASSSTRSSTAASTSSTSRARRPTTVAQLETLYNEMRRRLPHAALREQHQDAVRGRRDRLGPPARLHDDEPQGLRRDPGLPRRRTSTRAPRSRPVATSAPATGLASVEAVTGDGHARAERTRMRRSSRSDACSRYQMSSSIRSGQGSDARPLTCAQPVRPGRDGEPPPLAVRVLRRPGPAASAAARPATSRRAGR